MYVSCGTSHPPLILFSFATVVGVVQHAEINVSLSLLTQKAQVHNDFIIFFFAVRSEPVFISPHAPLQQRNPKHQCNSFHVD